jgi:hypothetical protein
VSEAIAPISKTPSLFRSYTSFIGSSIVPAGLVNIFCLSIKLLALNASQKMSDPICGDYGEVGLLLFWI